MSTVQAALPSGVGKPWQNLGICNTVFFLNELFSVACCKVFENCLPAAGYLGVRVLDLSEGLDWHTWNFS